MARQAALYEVVDAPSGEVQSRHRTRQAAVDAWRTTCSGMKIEIYRIGVKHERKLIVEGIWHEAAVAAVRQSAVFEP